MRLKSAHVKNLSAGADLICDSDVTNPKPPVLGFGIFCCVLSGLIYSINAMLVKMVVSVDAMQLAFCRLCVQFVILLPYVTYNWCFKSVDICGPSKMFKFLLIHGLSGSTSVICIYQAVRRISLGDAVTLSFSNVIFAGLLSCILLGESLTAFDGFMSLVAMAGIVLIAKPSFIFGDLGVGYDAENVIGVGFGLATGIAIGVSLVVVRKMSRSTHASLHVLYYSLIGSVCSGCILATTGSFKFPCLHELPYVFLIGLSGVGISLFLTIGLHYERAGTCAVLRSSQIVLVFCLQVVILHDIPSILSISGSSLIFLSILGVALRKAYNSKR